MDAKQRFSGDTSFFADTNLKEKEEWFERVFLVR